MTNTSHTLILHGYFMIYHRPNLT